MDKPRLGSAAAPAIVALAALVLVAASCAAGAGHPGATATTSHQPSGIRGVVLFAGGPFVLSPSPLPDGFGSGRQGRPYRFVTVQITVKGGAGAGRVVAKLKPGSQALFAVALPPGAYELKPLVPRNGPWPLTTEVVVRPGAYTRAIVYVEAP